MTTASGRLITAGATRSNPPCTQRPNESWPGDVVLPAHQENGQGRRHQQCHQQGRGQSQGEARHRRSGEGGDQSAHGQQRGQAQQHDQAGDDQRATTSHGDIGHDGDHGRLRGHAGTRRLQPAPDLRDVAQGVVDDQRDRRRDPHQGDHGEGLAPELEHPSGGDHRHRDRDGRGHRRPPAEQDDAESGEERHQGDDADYAEVVQGGREIVSRPEHRRLDGDAGQAGGHGLHRFLDVTGHLSRVRPREPLDHEHQAGGAVEAGVADQRLMVLPQGGHVADRELVPARALDRDVGELLRGGDRLDVLDTESL